MSQRSSICDYSDAYIFIKKVITVEDLSKQKALNADSRAIQQLSFEGIARQNLRLCTVLEFYKGTAKVLWEYINGLIQQSKCKIIRFTIK